MTADDPFVKQGAAFASFQVERDLVIERVAQRLDATREVREKAREAAARNAEKRKAKKELERAAKRQREEDERDVLEAAI
jgi:leucyl aminopeptidase (aminopeptidase T)